MPGVARDAGAGLILMHMRGTPATMQQAPEYPEGVLTALDREPTLTAEQTKKMKDNAVYHGQLEKGQPLVQIPILRESWQTDYDNPAFKDYTTCKRPLEP